MEERWTTGNVLLVILVALVAGAILLSGWSFGEIVLALALILVVIGAFYWLARRNDARQR